MFNRISNKAKVIMTAAGAALATFGQQVLAAIDVEGVTTAIEAAETSGQSVGTAVIGVVASLVVVGIVIGLVKKL